MDKTLKEIARLLKTATQQEQDKIQQKAEIMLEKETRLQACFTLFY